MAVKKRKKKVLLNRMKIKLALIFLIFLAFFAFMIYRITKINFEDGAKYEKRVLAQQRYDSISIPYRRGDILDCNGTELATSEKVYNLVLEPKNINADEEKRIATINALTQYFSLTQEAVEAMLEDSTSLYKVALKKLTYDEVTPFNDFLETEDGENVVGVWFEEEYKRYYPNGKLASHLLGFLSTTGNVGQGGIEGYYNDALNGTEGREYGYLKDDLTLERTVKPAINGYNIVTTIDANIQNIVENKVDAFMTETGAERVSVIVQDPNDGSILALYNSNYFNPNDPYNTDSIRYQFDGTEEEITAQIAALDDEQLYNALNQVWRNYAISDTFEPGSTFKPFTIAAALEEDVISDDETFVCDGFEVVADRTIHCHKLAGHGMVTIAEAMAYSCNDALMQVGAKLGRTTFAKYQTVFGFGLKTNIDLPGEAYTANLIYTEEGLNPVELATSSFGQSLSVSMIQLSTAFCSLINGGDYYEPRVVQQIVDNDGNVIENYDGTVLRKTVSQETSDKIKDYLFQVVEIGTAAKTGKIEGYTIGGKTGTAEKLPRGTGKYIISFVGFAPVEKPEVLVYVTVDEPHMEDPSHSGIATIIAKDIMEELLPYMNIFQSNQEEDQPLTENAEPEATVPIYEDNNNTTPIAGDAEAASEEGTSTEATEPTPESSETPVSTEETTQ